MVVEICARCRGLFAGSLVTHEDGGDAIELCDRCVVEAMAPLIALEEGARQLRVVASSGLVDGKQGGASGATPPADPSSPCFHREVGHE